VPLGNLSFFSIPFQLKPLGDSLLQEFRGFSVTGVQRKIQWSLAIIASQSQVSASV
jgi:hypothetical protein